MRCISKMNYEEYEKYFEMYRPFVDIDQWGILIYDKQREFAREYLRVRYECGEFAMELSRVYHEYGKFALE